jgi:lysophospholipase L1-like esterase
VRTSRRSRQRRGLAATVFAAVAGVAIVAACAAVPVPTVSPGPATPSAAAPAALRYVALGDSYTIGTGVAEADRWPDQLVARLATDPPARPLELVANLAVNGFTAGSVARVQLPRLESGLQPGFVSLLVGVNDVVQDVPEAAYRTDVDEVLARLLALLPANRVVCVETPDYTVTPMGAEFGDPATRRAGIVRVNAILREACEARGIRFVDGILAISTAAADSQALVAQDGLHPSGAQYRRWVDERIEPVVRELLGQP